MKAKENLSQKKNTQSRFWQDRQRVKDVVAVINELDCNPFSADAILKSLRNTKFQSAHSYGDNFIKKYLHERILFNIKCAYDLVSRKGVILLLTERICNKYWFIAKGRPPIYVRILWISDDWKIHHFLQR